LAGQRLALVFWIALVVGLAVGSVTRQAIWLLALVGLPLLISGRRCLWQQGLWRRWVFWWSLFAVPIVLAMPDAVDPERGMRAAIRMLSYLLMGVVIFRWPLARSDQSRYLLWSGVLLSLLLVDGIVQFFVGFNVGGEPLYQDIRYGQRITGFLGIDYGWVIAVLSPFILEAARVAGRSGWFFWVAVPLLLIAVLLSGSRASALLMLMGWAAYFAMLWARLGFGPARQFMQPLLAACVLALTAVFIDPDLHQRWSDALGVFAADPARWDEALSLRPSLWSTSLSVFQEHWVNGVGLRGFGEVAATDLAKVDGLPDKPQGWSPHLAVLEVATNLGVIGLIAYCGFYTSLVRWIALAPISTLAPGLSAALAFFPFGSTLPLFSMRVASVAWLCLAMALVLAREQQQQDDEAAVACVG
jgi:hypothetical protein